MWKCPGGSDDEPKDSGGGGRPGAGGVAVGDVRCCDVPTLMSRTRDDFLNWCVMVHGAVLEHPFRGLSGKRRFRYDAAWPDLLLAVDYTGLGAGHQWADGQAMDHEKINEAQLCGWMFLLVGAKSCNDGTAYSYVEQAIGASRDWKEAQANTPGDLKLLRAAHHAEEHLG